MGVTLSQMIYSRLLLQGGREGMIFNLESPRLNNIWEMKLLPHIVTSQAWTQQYTQFGHVDPKKVNANHCANQGIYDQNLFQLAIYCAPNLKVTTRKIHLYLFNLQKAQISTFLSI